MPSTKYIWKIIHQRVCSKLEQDWWNSTWIQEYIRDTRSTVQLPCTGTKFFRCKSRSLCLLLQFNNAYDRVRHDRIIEILIDKTLDPNNIRIYRNIHYNQKAMYRKGMEMYKDKKRRRQSYTNNMKLNHERSRALLKIMPNKLKINN